MAGPHTDTAERLDVDYSERAGFLTGKSEAIARWRAKKEDNDFKKLCARLYARNWARKERARAPERVRERLRSWRERNRDHVRALERARRAPLRKGPRRIPGVCAVCGAPGVKDRPWRFCARRCANRYWGVHRKPRNRGLRNMRIRQTIEAILAAEPGLTLGEICARALGCSYRSVAVLLCEWTKAGRLVRTVVPGRRGGGYSLAQPEGTAEPCTNRTTEGRAT